MILVIIIISICANVVSGKAEREHASPVQGHFTYRPAKARLSG
ncbi:hypothetical protein HMPREF0358_4614 [Escherichia coli 83972]|nr:hypothetical protein HMPREF0358_4614 [Escherichia coli 83972]